MGGVQWWHFLVLLVLLALVALFVGALVSIATSRHLDNTAKAIWIVVCVFLQFFGPVAWFVWGRHQRPRSEGPPSRPLY